MNIYTTTELEEKINQIIKESIEEVMKRVHHLLLQHINIDTYRIRKNEDGHPKINKVYLNRTGIPTYEFREKAWTITKYKDYVGAYAMEIFYDGLKMSPPSAQYPSRHVVGRENLANLLNISGEFGHKERSPFWDNFIIELKENLGKWLYYALKKRGLVIPELSSYHF